MFGLSIDVALDSLPGSPDWIVASSGARVHIGRELNSMRPRARGSE